VAETQILWRWGQRLPGQIRVLSRQLLFTQPPIDLFQKIVDLEMAIPPQYTVKHGTQGEQGFSTGRGL